MDNEIEFIFTAAKQLSMTGLLSFFIYKLWLRISEMTDKHTDAIKDIIEKFEKRIEKIEGRHVEEKKEVLKIANEIRVSGNDNLRLMQKLVSQIRFESKEKIKRLKEHSEEIEEND